MARSFFSYPRVFPLKLFLLIHPKMKEREKHDRLEHVLTSTRLAAGNLACCSSLPVVNNAQRHLVHPLHHATYARKRGAHT